ncbi:hypothetical protein BSLG_005728 [Batrachochytrium salamandrivorans]|nr:hypothetical protein BSLG_005728 [Batrachochytrium salamandrivorans]
MQKRDAERLEMADLVEQASLMEVKGRRPRLPDVFVRPGLEGKRFPGDLEIHLNGLRYQSQLKSDQKIDILFSNVKHLFPAVRRRVNYGDEDELAQEQEERRKRLQLNREFQQFSERIKQKKVLVDVPLRDVAFSGVPFRQLVTLQPTRLSGSSIRYAILVIPVKDIEIAHLERVQFGLKNFDLVFVYKDFHKAVSHINTIPTSQIETVREWLDSSDIPFSEGPVNLSWPQIMKTINDDPRAFLKRLVAGRFTDRRQCTLLNRENGSSEEDSISEFEMSGSSSAGSESDSDDSENDGSNVSGSDFSESGSGEDESGEDWDELERKAAQHDRKRHDREEGRADRDDDDRRSTKRVVASLTLFHVRMRI